MGSQAEHGQLVDAALVRLSERGVLAWRAPVGVGSLLGTRRVMRFGLPGQSDILAVLPPRGRLLGLEAKTGRARQSKQQRAFEARVRQMGGAYHVFRSVAELDHLLEELLDD